MDFFRDPAWQGIGAVASICALLLYVYVERTRIFPSRSPRPARDTVLAQWTHTIAELLGYTIALIWIGAKDGVAPGIIAVLFLILRQSSEQIIAEIGRYGFLLTVTIGLYFPARFSWYLFHSKQTKGTALWLLLFAIGATWTCIFIAILFWPALGEALRSIF